MSVDRTIGIRNAATRGAAVLVQGVVVECGLAASIWSMVGLQEAGLAL